MSRTTPLASDASFAQAYAEHAPAMTDVAHGILRNRSHAQDVVQDVFLRLWDRPESYDAARGDLGTYLRMLVRSRAVDAWRQVATARRAAERLEAMATTQIDDEPDGPAHRKLERADERARVRHALRTLPTPQREALVLTYWGGMTAEQVADRAAIPVGTAKSRVRLGLQRLRRHEQLAATG